MLKQFLVGRCWWWKSLSHLICCFIFFFVCCCRCCCCTTWNKNWVKKKRIRNKIMMTYAHHIIIITHTHTHAETNDIVMHFVLFVFSILFIYTYIENEWNCCWISFISIFHSSFFSLSLCSSCSHLSIYLIWFEFNFLTFHRKKNNSFIE